MTEARPEHNRFRLNHNRRSGAAYLKFLQQKEANSIQELQIEKRH
jgi:hypothetical protein